MVGQLTYRVLLVEDEPVLRKLISAYLVAAGYVVRVAVDGLDALAKLRTGLPDLIISDLNMPRMSGLELLGVVRRRFPQIPVIAVSADDEMPEGLAADAHFRKNGFGFERILEIMADVTSQPPRPPAPQLDSNPMLARSDGDGRYNLDCLDCLRVFSIPRDRYARRHVQWTTCVHCGTVVQYQVADQVPILPARPQVQALRAVGVCS